ncbi:hypothetical protein [Quatrionicoccus australiensis]|uniref:hypothetical protein n=1 Tax=Quatrionicoccus australiensis TaxID=138118 RepID=UPI001CF9CB13|nr:hypothetical protein [Quatrionicoccus australiensis]MCB4359293.1 hypothetical protein [Quatrionicoccus australiensis]
MRISGDKPGYRDVLWQHGSLSNLYHQPFNARLVEQDFPPPYSQENFRDPVQAPGYKTGTCSASSRALSRPELDAAPVGDIRQAEQLGIPIGNERFAETICGREGVLHNSGKRGRPNGPANEASAQPITSQQDLGF